MADLFDQTGIPTGEIGALPLPALSPDELGLPVPLQQALAAQQLPRPTAPQPVLSDPKQKLAALAALGFALGSGPHSGGAGALSGILQAQQQLGQQKQQEFQRQQAEIDKQNQQLEIQQRAAAADLERRRQAFANGVKILEPQIRAAKTPEQYRSAVTMASSALQAAGFRTPPQWFMANMPYQAPTLQQEASDTVDKVMKSPAVQDALKRQGDEAFDSIAIPLHVQGPSQPTTPVTLRQAHKLAGIDIGVSQGGVAQAPLGQLTPWQAALDQAANEFQVSFKRAADQKKPEDRVWIEKRAQEIAKPPKESPAAANAVNNRLDRSYQFNATALQKERAPVAQLLEKAQRGLDDLNQQTPAADALVAPLILSVSAGGQGSGLRMNEAEIARVVGGRSVWENLKARIQHWSLNPSQALTLTPSQRQQMRQILTAMQSKAAKKVDLLNQADEDLINAEDVTQHRGIVVNARKGLAQIDVGDQTIPASGRGGIPAVGEMFNGGKVLKIEKVP